MHPEASRGLRRPNEHQFVSLCFFMSGFLQTASKCIQMLVLLIVGAGSRGCCLATGNSIRFSGCWVGYLGIGGLKAAGCST